MGYHSKEAYEGKREYAAKRMAKNEGILPDNIHEQLEKLCKMRHEMHSCRDAMFHEESSDYGRLTRYFYDVNIEVDDELSLVIDISDYWISEFDYYQEREETGNDDENRELRDEYIERYYKCKEDLNNQIEAFLREVDKKYNTCYCPTGLSRE